MAAQHRDKQK